MNCLKKRRERRQVGVAGRATTKQYNQYGEAVSTRQARDAKHSSLFR
jgi:hypothetical protein